MTDLEQRTAEPYVLERLSPSRASDFLQCPQLFEYRTIQRLPEETTVHQARGTTAHLALQHLFDLPKEDRTADRLYDLFRAAWTELRTEEEYEGLFDSVEEERAWGLESMKLLRNYFTVEDPGAIEPLGRELDLLEEVTEGVVIRGILDRMDETPEGDLVILDYKTGKAPPQRYAASAFFALKIYAALIRKRTGRTPIEVRLMYLNGPTQLAMPITDELLDQTEQRIATIWNQIERAIETETFPPSPSKLCGWCSFQDICPAFADES
jgi:putative RecB family exonuclease